MIDAAWTDAVLAVVALGAGFRLLRHGAGAATAGVGLFLVGVAAVFGVVRFSGVDTLAPTHWGVSRLASLVGVPLVGVGWATEIGWPDRAQQVRPYAFVLLLVAAVALIAVPLYGTVIGALGMGLVAMASLVVLRRAPMVAAFGLLGASGVAVSGLVILGEGSMGPLSRVAWFHLALAGSFALLGEGLVRFSRARVAAEAPRGD
ncbi:MAG: hypothetical protein KTR31_36980 [Myxococcales bacterium]|nr:hypothetical protein [Myxococcales bacterium]